MPRRNQILSHWHFVLSVILAFVATWACSKGPIQNISISEVSSALLAFTALSFGACVTGAILTLTIPSEALVRRLVTKPTGVESDFSHLSDLVFVFTWSAITQLALLVVVVLMYLLGGDISVWPNDPHFSHVVLLYFAALVGSYSVIRLVSTVTTISQIAVFIITEYTAPNGRD